MKDKNTAKRYRGKKINNNKGAVSRKMIIICGVVLVLLLDTILPSVILNRGSGGITEIKTHAANKDNIPADVEFSAEDDRVRNTYAVDENTYDLSNSDRIIDFSRAYYSYPNRYQNATIILGVTQGSYDPEILADFIALGTSSYPFKGTVRIVNSASYELQLPEAFFDYVYDSVKFIDNEHPEDETDISMIFERTTVANEPVIARHVKHDENLSTANTWKVTVNPYVTNTVSNNYRTAGFIGEMMSDAMLDIEITDNTSMLIENSASGEHDVKDVGYVCGVMETGSTLTVKSITSANTAYSVTSGSGNAGGVVGRMMDGSTLTLCCEMPNTAAEVTASGSGKYAGGIVGYNDGGSVISGKDSNDADIFSQSSRYSIENTVSGTSGSGGVFGYYKPAFDNGEATLDISWLQVGAGASTRMNANGTGAAGGLIGMLVNELQTTTGEGAQATTTYSSGDLTITDGSAANNKAVVYSDHTAGNATDYGGLIGKYTARELSGSLNIEHIKVNSERSNGAYANYGGGIGETVTGNNPVYVKFDDFNAEIISGNGESGEVYGGLVAASHNAFIDAHDVTLKSDTLFRGGGVVGAMEDGVLRLSGTTDLTGSKAPAGDENQGQIVGERDNSLVFAEASWELKRGDTCSVDDIGSWGEVIRFDGTSTSSSVTTEKLGNNAVLTVDETAHTVEIAEHTVTSGAVTVSSEADFAKVALGFEIDATENPCLSFENDWCNRSIVTSMDITLGADIDLSGTGLTGFTRDNSYYVSVPQQDGSTKKVEHSEYCQYNGNFDGAGHTITLATGEPYGSRGDTQLSSHGAEGNGKIYRHRYTGLFGIITDGGYNTTDLTVKDLTLDGTVDINAQTGTFYCGGFAARAIKAFTAKDVNTGIAMTNGGDKLLYMGRLIGEMGTTSTTIDISRSENGSCVFGGSISGDNSHKDTCLGGVIGRISHNNDDSRTWNFTNVTLEGSIDNTSVKTTQKIGGLIAEIDGTYNANANHRMLTLDGVTVNGLQVSGKLTDSSSSMGGLLGYSWLKTDVDLVDVTVQDKTVENQAATKSSVSITNNAAGNAAGIVYRATGRWDVQSLDIDNIKMTATNANSVGMIVNRGHFHSGTGTTFYSAANRSAIYMRLPSASSYSLTLDGTSINASAIFDELCAYTCPSEADIMKNGNGIISINTAGFNTDGSTASGSYHAQTSYGAKPNPNSRYYYNLDALDNEITSNTTGTESDTKLNTDPKKLMSWGVNVYACANLKQYFADVFNGTITDETYDMQNFSWYPVTLNSGITLNGTFTLYNKEFEGSEKAKFNNESTNAYWRTSLYDSANSKNTQHYLMHNALFYNVESCTLNLGAVTLQGDVAGYTKSGTSASICGALVCGTVSGTSTSNVGTVKMTGSGSITLNGIEIYNDESAVDKATAVSSYAPLLINKLGSHSALNLANVTTTTAYNYDSNNDSTNDSTHIVATSLVGDAGSSTATDINIEFKKITLDARNDNGKAETSHLGNASEGNFLSTANNDPTTSMYQTYRSIFSHATLLNSFSFGSNSTGRYDYTWKEDWDVNNDGNLDTSHKGNVTYGKELGYDLEHFPVTGAEDPYYNSQYPKEEIMYVGQTTYYTNPINGNDTTSDYGSYGLTNYINNFLPYVYTKYNADNKTYQLRVNHAAVSAAGCGTYNHPYIIYNGSDIEKYCRWINDNTFNGGDVIRIPTAGLDLSETYIPAITGTWCETDGDHADCTYDNAGYFTVTIDGNTKRISSEVMRKYLAGAYYQIDPDVSNNDLVINVDSDETRTFKGFGATDNAEFRFRGVIDGNGKIITNKTTAPFIYYSNGCVVKNLTINVEPDDDILLVGYQKSFDNMWQSKSAANADGNAAYGAVISRVMGGDTIIDNVYVSFANMTTHFDLRAKFAQLVPVGGYVGVVVNGGVIFRNMQDVNGEHGPASAYAASGVGLRDSLIHGNTNTAYNPTGASKPADYYVTAAGYTTTGGYLESNAWLYVNPIVGRVINGFAVTEGDYYLPYEDGSRVYKGGETNVTKYWDKANEEETTDETNDHVTLQNGNKHYSIADIKKNDNKIGINGNTVTADDGQAFFIMSLIVNSGMANKSLGYNEQYFVSRSAEYNYIGTETKTDYTGKAENDYLPYSSTAANSYKTTRFGYLANTYTTPTAESDNAGVLKNNSSLTITLGGDIYLPDGYKGIGNMYNHDNSSTNNVDENDNYRIKVSDFDGDGNKISINSSWNYYFTDASNNGTLTAFDTVYAHHTHPGFGLFNYQSGETNSDTNCYHDFVLTGNVVTECINSASVTGDPVKYKGANTNTGTAGYVPKSDNEAKSIDNNCMVSAGGLIGVTNNTQYLDSVALRNIYVHGIRNAGGLIGLNAAAETKAFTYRNTEEEGSSQIRVISAASAGGMIGKTQAANINIDNNNSSYSITLVESECQNISGSDFNYGVGAFIGACRAQLSNIINISRITVGSENQLKPSFVKAKNANIFTGGMIGIINQGTLTITDCTVYNQSVDAKYIAGGLVGHYATARGPAEISNVKVLAKDYTEIEDPKIVSTYKAVGGFIGSIKDEFSISNPPGTTNYFAGKLDIHDSEIKGYDISINSDGICYAGGAVGLFGHDAGGTNYDITWNLYNVSINDCSINATSNKNNEYGYSGGIVGGIAERQNKYKYLYGYNILTKNLDITGDKCGGIYGKMLNATDCCIKLAGFSRQGTPMIEALAGAPAVADKLFGNDGYVVFADYNDKASTEQNKLFPSLGYTVNNVVDTIGLGTTVTTTTNRYVVLRNSESADDSIGAGNVTVVSSLPEVVETNSGAYDSTLTAGTTTSYIRLRAAARDGFYLSLRAFKKENKENNDGPYYFKLPQDLGKGSVLPETKNTDEAVIWFLESVGNYYKLYTYDSGDVKKYLHQVGTSNNVELSNVGSQFEIDNAVIGSTNVTHIKLQGSNKYLQYSNGGKGVRFYDGPPSSGDEYNYEFKLVSSGTKDYNNVTYRAWEYDSLNISGSSITSVNAPFSKSDATAAQQTDYTANCGSYNSDDYELFYVIETVVEQNTSFEDNSKPYVTTNPRTDISATQFLTSDGAGYLGSAVSYPYSSIGKILTDVSAGTSPKRYTIAKDSVGAATDTLITKLTTYGKFSSYQQETGANAGTSYDFPVLIVDEVLEDDCTSYINAYLQYLTNTEFNFADGRNNSDNKAIFNIEIGSMVWDGTKFVYTSGKYDANTNPGGSYFYQKKEEQKFAINGKKFDNTEYGRFTLMDVQFYDPADTNTDKKIAYHVYVPIIVKKMLQYDFNTAMLSGTNYRVQPYIDANGSTLIENIGNTVTMLAQWKYRRTVAEWQKELESGNNFLIALDKTLQLNIPTGRFPSETHMILVDANNNNKYYQAETGTQGLITNVSGNEYIFDLSKFSDGVNTFSPVEFNDMFTFTVSAASPDDTTKFAVVEEPQSGTTEQDYINAGATVCINGVYYKPASDGTYDIQLAYKNDSADGFLTENYYISFFTDSSATTTDNTDLYHLHFYDKGTFNEPSYPTKVLTNTNTHFLTGNIFVNDINLSNLNPEQVMSAANNEIYTTLTAEVGINSAIRSTVQPYLSRTNDKVTVYQSLLVMLNKIEDGEQQKGILTEPGVNVTNFTVKRADDSTVVLIADAKTAAHAQDATKNYQEIIDQNYIELRNNVNLRNYLYDSCQSGYNLSVQADVKLSYTDLVIQFPTRDSVNLHNDNIGTVMGASSNISSTSAAAAYSKTAYENWSTLAYYITVNTNAILTLNSDDSTNPYGDYYQLGINDLDMDADYLDLDEYGNSKMKLNALYDVSDLSTADEANLMKLTVSIRKKADYSIKLHIDDYITDLVLKDANGTSFASNVKITVNETADAVEYTYTIADPQTTLQYDADSKTYQIPITFTVYSAENFATLNPSLNFQYSNYMINLNAKLYKGYAATNANYLDGSNDDDHVIWTNAKIVYNVFEN